VVETETVPKTYFSGTRRMPLHEGGTEPIGMRVIEVPEDAERVELRDPKSGFIAYAPPGSLAKGWTWSRPAATARPLPARSATGRRSRASARCRALPVSRR
jgi:hypothetical protein